MSFLKMVYEILYPLVIVKHLHSNGYFHTLNGAYGLRNPRLFLVEIRSANGENYQVQKY
jgi:hypothetical protein